MPETAAVVQSAWQDALSSIQMLADLIQTCQDAFTEDDAAPKVGGRLSLLCVGQLVPRPRHPA